MTELSRTIKEFRKRHLLTIRDCEPIFGMSHNRIWQLEKGRNHRDVTQWKIEKAIAEYEKGEEK